ncbi:NCS1 nucleoside transporter family [Polyporus arcularius HHB13444]|uniref:NCS1 nucleoside transporter family n=1 Tax=Polyporus arcularius HHB13444 TaxID=1314778 RepID=A0A5C3NTP2_9APHY|nr:NCS1 nucleoside transporter family [Polyporus arcularius HHB13444]
MKFSDVFKPTTWALDSAHSRRSNADMEPVPLDKRTWTAFNYIAYWISDAWTVPCWQLASGMLAVGLSWRQALLAVLTGETIVAVVMVLNGTIGARLHVGFPVLARSSFGFWFSYFAVISRIVLSMIWSGITSYVGSQCIYQMLRAVWPSIAYMPNQLPQSAHMTTSGMICYFLWWILLMPFMFLSPQRIRWLFTLKAIIVPPAYMAILIWAIVRVPVREGLLQQQTQLSGSTLSYAWLSAMNSAIGNYASLTVNIPDFTRYAKNARAQYVQLLIIPVAFTLVAFTGIAVTSAGTVLYGEVLWNPLKLIERWESRPAAFFAAFVLTVATLGTSVSGNTLSVGNDLTSLCPKYINIRRGQLFAATVGQWAGVPWDIQSNAQGFLRFLSGYTVFLGPFAGIMVADYWIVHRCKVDVQAMYDPHGRYRYTYGVNWRAVVTLILAVAPNLPGLIASISPAIKSQIGNAHRIFDIAWLFGFFTAVVVYSVLSLLFPPSETFVPEECSDVDDPGAEGNRSFVDSEKP